MKMRVLIFRVANTIAFDQEGRQFLSKLRFALQRAAQDSEEAAMHQIANSQDIR
jgi:hypothetical protein